MRMYFCRTVGLPTSVVAKNGSYLPQVTGGLSSRDLLLLSTSSEIWRLLQWIVWHINFSRSTGNFLIIKFISVWFTVALFATFINFHISFHSADYLQILFATLNCHLVIVFIGSIKSWRTNLIRHWTSWNLT